MDILDTTLKFLSIQAQDFIEDGIEWNDTTSGGLHS